MAQPSLVFIGVGGNVVAVDNATGQEVWRTQLKGRDFVNIALQGDDLYATNKGELYCLDPATGRIRWQNPLKGLGWGLISIATATGNQSVLMREKRQRDEAAAASAT